ncbi:MAG: hypothetical protein ACKO1U_06885 [Bacteroidota bacterium]
MKALRIFLEPVAADLTTVLVHGSQADGHTTGYSDLDALVILSDEVFTDTRRLARVARQLSAARKFMFLIDPLQHHGWFVMTARDLSAYPENVLPFSALADARVLLGAEALGVTQPVVDGFVYRTEAFRTMSRMTLRLSEGYRPQTAYAAKSFLSECMMLPVLYQQARDRKGCSKKDSFSSVSVDFSPEDWSVVEELTSIRQQWEYRPPAVLRPVLLSTSAWSWELRKRIPLPIPAKVARRLAPEFFLRVMTLIHRMKERLEPKPASGNPSD